MSYLTFTSVGSTSVTLSSFGTPNQIDLKYSKAHGTWQSYTIGEEIALGNGQDLRFAIDPNSTNGKFSKTIQSRYNFITTGTGTLTLSGDLSSLVSSALIEDEYEFNSLFSGCTNITDASQLTLPGNTTNWCYSNMFKNCSNLTTPPSALPATTLSPWCYQGMFANCSSLTTTPLMSSTEMSRQSYYAMFYNCTSLTDSPSLPAEELQNWCYNALFYKCENLSAITCDLSAFSPSSATKNWVYGVASAGTFTNGSVTEEFGTDKIPSGWQLVSPTPFDPSTEPLTFKAIDGDAKIKLSGSTSQNLSYSTDGGKSWNTFSNWNNWITIPSGTSIALSGNNTYWNSYDEGSRVNKFDLSGGKVEVEGNIVSLINFSNELPVRNVFAYLFQNVTNCQLYAHNLYFPSAYTYTRSDPSERTGPYNKMFEGCTALRTAPILRQITIPNDCYQDMFNGCSNLSSKVVFECTNDAIKYYSVGNCPNVKCIEVNWTTWYSGQYSSWCDSVASKGTFIKPRNLSRTFSNSNIPSGWKVVNKEDGHMYICNTNNTSDYTQEVASVADNGVITLTNGTIITP